MSESGDRPQPEIRMTDITLVTGAHHCVEGDVKAVERKILDAARGSILQLAWFIDADSRDDLAINPEHVVLLRAARARNSD